jgi:hypothetical protein
LTVGQLRSLRMRELTTYHGESTIMRKTLDWNRSRISMGDSCMWWIGRSVEMKVCGRQNRNCEYNSIWTKLMVSHSRRREFGRPRRRYKSSLKLSRLLNTAKFSLVIRHVGWLKNFLHSCDYLFPQQWDSDDSVAQTVSSIDVIINRLTRMIAQKHYVGFKIPQIVVLWVMAPYNFRVIIPPVAPCSSVIRWSTVYSLDTNSVVK